MAIRSTFAGALGMLLLGLGATSACGGDDAGDDSDGAAGDVGAGGSTSNTGGGGGTGARGGGGNEGGGDSGGGTGVGPGEFGSIWKQGEAQILVYDTQGGTLPDEVNVQIPALHPLPESDSRADVYESIEEGVLITYARVDDAPSYYRIKSPLTSTGDLHYKMLGNQSGYYQIEDGVLTLTSTLAVGTKVAMVTTRFEKYTGDFPPADWPSEVVELDMTAGGAQ